MPQPVNPEYCGLRVRMILTKRGREIERYGTGLPSTQ